MAGFKSERAAGFHLGCMAGFIGIRSSRVGPVPLGTSRPAVFSPYKHAGKEALRAVGAAARADRPDDTFWFADTAAPRGGDARPPLMAARRKLQSLGDRIVVGVGDFQLFVRVNE
jgi:hypothetical protein